MPSPRKLPVLSSSLLPQIPVDDPALHQGRIRTSPHIEGQFAAYVYVPLVLDRRSTLYKLLLSVLRSAKSLVPIIHNIGIPEESQDEAAADSPKDEYELHISLTRPTYLRAHQREDFKRALKAIAASHSGFRASFATFAELTNDEGTRTFLTLEVGAGHEELKALSDALIPMLRSIRQKEFYADPRFHASIAWALLSNPLSEVVLESAPDTPSTARISSSTGAQLLTQPDRIQSGSDLPRSSAGQNMFPTISHFPPSLIPRLKQDFGSTLTSRQVGMFHVEEVCVRIGKEVSKWRLSNWM
ncbi:U6 snRNA phosphodiesterase [Grifola frondosa]|uniref:U6 snRNA phosphodiesterase 1 n=1 Tax=Grifola frondosa TaxID=5627 RepID=A0A1C7M2D4_GRIFR|nr:U6 snRNA phosphodiesterase [Grifola frondosa]